MATNNDDDSSRNPSGQAESRSSALSRTLLTRRPGPSSVHSFGRSRAEKMALLDLVLAPRSIKRRGSVAYLPNFVVGSRCLVSGAMIHEG